MPMCLRHRLKPRGQWGTVDTKRLARIQDKLLHAENRIGLFMEWHEAAAESLKDRMASYKAVQEAAEALADATALILKGSGIPPHDDYHNYEALAAAGAVTAATLRVLSEFNGLRNALVHDYDEISDERALDAAERLAPEILDAIEEVRIWLSSTA